MELTTFLKACEYNDTETVSHMLKSGFDVNSTNHKGRTGLMTACLFDSAEVVSILVEEDHLDVNAQDYEGHGAIHFMIYSEDESEEDESEEDESGIPSEKRVTIARLLVETAGANVNLNTADDYWPIEEVIATYHGWESQPQYWWTQDANSHLQLPALIKYARFWKDIGDKEKQRKKFYYPTGGRNLL